MTGGQSALQLYTAWASLQAFGQMTGVSFFFGDERCVAPIDADSNYHLAMRSLFRYGVPSGCTVFRVEADAPDLEAAARRYGTSLPERPDLLLLGVGEDGHIASLFPNSPALQQLNQKVVPITGPILPRKRLTITPPVIANSKLVYLLARGKDKGSVLASALASRDDYMSMPVRLTLSGTWLLDNLAAEKVLAVSHLNSLLKSTEL